jgi:hypothetical protein
MAHYVVVLQWGGDSCAGCNVLGVTHSLDEAKEIFQDTVVEERNSAEEYGWNISTDSDMEFSANDGCILGGNYSILFIQEVM